MSDFGLALLRFAYYAGAFGTFAFLVTWEADDPKVASPVNRLRHILRNVALLGLVIVIADVLVLGWLLRVP